jgi:hypothetical protein
VTPVEGIRVSRALQGDLGLLGRLQLLGIYDLAPSYSDDLRLAAPLTMEFRRTEEEGDEPRTKAKR